MHEFSITSQIVEKVLEEANKRNAKKVKEVHLSIGKLTFLGIEQVRFSYEVLIKNTIMEKSKLIIKEKEGIVRCEKCEYKGSIPYTNDSTSHLSTPTFGCPNCGECTKIVEGKECILRNIRIVV